MEIVIINVVISQRDRHNNTDDATLGRFPNQKKNEGVADVHCHKSSTFQSRRRQHKKISKPK